MTNLPLYFAIKRYRPNIDHEFPDLEPYKNLAVLIQSRKNPNGSWKMELVDNPLLLIQDSSVTSSFQDIWFNKRIVEIPICKHSSTNTINLRIKYNDTILVNSEYTIPLLKISDPCQVLSESFYNLNLPENLSYGFELNNVIPSVSGSLRSTLQEKPQESKIPSHIMAAYIQSLLDKKDLCPITMEPLERDTLYVTTCGHAMTKSAATTWITQKKSCPVCRTALNYI